MDNVFVYFWWFDLDNTVQYLSDFIYIIVVSRLQVYEEEIKLLLCLPLPDVNHVSDFVAVAK